MPEHTPEEIIRMIDGMEMDRSEVQDRMDQDFDRYNLEPYQGEMDEDGEPILDGYKKFTANDPRTTMNLALHLGSTSKRTIKIHKVRDQRDQREINNMKELFCLGAMEAIDERRHHLMMPTLQEGLFSQCAFRGRWAQRVLLVKEDIEEEDEEILAASSQDEQILAESGLENMLPESNTRTYIDVIDWDPRNTYWGMGRHGLNWACNKSWKCADDIEAEYGVRPEGTGPTNSGEDRGKDFAIYDFLDTTDNVVVLEGGVELKKRTPHGMKRVPATIGIVGPLPLFQANGKDYDANYGESFYQADRLIFDQQNFLYSIMAELSKRSIKQPLLLMSRDGNMTLESDPRTSGTEVSLSTSDDQDIKPLPPMEMVREHGAFLGLNSAMMQRGTFPSTAFGDLAFQLSGFAITQLKQGLEAPITPHLIGTKTAIKEILDILADAYATGDFDTITLAGRLQDPQRSYFSEDISPDLISEGGTIEVNLVAQLPQDDLTKMNLAQQARQGPVPLFDDRFIREEILEVQDVEQLERAVWEQLGDRGSPAAIAFRSMVAAAQQGNQESAEIWQMEFQMAMMTKLLEMMQLQSVGGGSLMGGGGPGGPGGPLGGAGGPGGGGGEGRPPMPPSNVMPPQALGINATPSPQGGPNVPPGTPRPGAGRPGFPPF